MFLSWKRWELSRSIQFSSRLTYVFIIFGSGESAITLKGWFVQEWSFALYVIVFRLWISLWTVGFSQNFDARLSFCFLLSISIFCTGVSRKKKIKWWVMNYIPPTITTCEIFHHNVSLAWLLFPCSFVLGFSNYLTFLKVLWFGRDNFKCRDESPILPVPSTLIVNRILFNRLLYHFLFFGTGFYGLVHVV